MFYLWIGVMAGILLAYAWAHIPAKGEKSQPQVWLAIAGAILLLVPVAWDLWRTSTAYFGPIESIKAVLLPWLAGFGFGIWAFLIAPQAAPASWIPLLVALIFVAVIVSDERYGWLDRLQKITVGGGGVEFAALTPAAPSSSDSSAISVSGGQQGVGRIGFLVASMSQFASFIGRDQQYATELGLPFKPEDFKGDLDFAEAVIAPLGARLHTIHQAQGYNDVGILIDRSFIDSFRALTQGFASSASAASSTERQAAVRDRIKTIWRRACDTEAQLRAAGHIAPSTSLGPGQDAEECNNELNKAVKFLDALSPSASAGGFNLNPALPYGTLLSALLLNAAGEIDSAVKDLDRWLAQNPPTETEKYKWLGAYRLLFTSATLLARDNPTGARAYYMILEYRKVISLGDWLLTSTVASQHLPWRTQVKRLQDGDTLWPVWRTSVCGNDLSSNFKRFMIANLTAKNNYAYFLSQNLLFAKEQGLEEEMKTHGEYLAEISIRCLQQDMHSMAAQAKADSTQASLLDTAANVELGLASRELQRAERRERLCKAQKYIERAIALNQQSALADPRPPNWATAKDKKLMPWQALETWHVVKEQLDNTETRLILLRRLERVRAKLAENGMAC